jgi:hypothetical protein
VEKDCNQGELMPLNFSVLNGDVTKADADVLVLKFADRLRGADLAVARAIGSESLSIETGSHRFFPSKGRIRASEILFLGVGPLYSFEYQEIGQFGRTALEVIARERPQARCVALTIHGPGYGLDELASTDSLVRGLVSGSRHFPKENVKVVLVERSKSRSERLEDFLYASGLINGDRSSSELNATYRPNVAELISRNRTYEKRLFASMPFGQNFLDHWELALQPAAHENNLLIERLDHESFVGDIVTEIRNRITKSAAVVALLDGGNPNVFLEVGYAWGVGKPTILVLSETTDPPFDVRGQRIVRYGRIGALKTMLTAELKALASAGFL